MTSTIKVNNIQNQCGQNIINENSNTITIGASGDTIALASGASQSGFGRSGSVNWQTSIKTADFTAASGEGYFCDTASVGAFTLTLPSSPSVGDIVALKDYASNFATANLTIGRGGSNLNGNADDSVRNTDNESLTLVYADATKGWLAVEEGTGYVGENYISATGGTITASGNDRIHTFTGPGTFAVCRVAGCAANNQVSYIVVGSGASGGSANNNNNGAGGGGAGGFREDKSPVTPYTSSPLEGAGAITVTATSYPITIGAGGGASSPTNPGTAGNTSTFSTISSAGGGQGGFNTSGSGGASGGGGADTNPGGSGNSPPTNPAQGSDGGNGTGAGGPSYGGGGGGGATAVGVHGATSGAGAGGAGATTSINGTPTTYSGGGGGGAYSTGTAGAGGSGGGGAGTNQSGNGTAGTANTGGGGGAANTPSGTSGAGGSGVVIIRYKIQ